MGLDTTHDAWHGPYSAFHLFRQALIAAIGGTYTEVHPAGYDWTYDDAIVPSEHVAGLSVLLNHSDCDGEISPDDCLAVAAALEWVAPRMPDDGAGALSEFTPRARALQFAKGCRLASEKGEALEFC